ncbi:MAG: methyltransferase domain-containing protein [Legionellales bacterium]|nr:methyltransferase domain-containing protein [Legionellales bacterium]
MSNITHLSALATHYDQEAKRYDVFNEKRSKQINQLIENVLQENNVKTVLDLACGTGSQVFWLTEKGFDVVGIDINDKMLSIARQKANQKGIALRFENGDMRSNQGGQFDAVLTIFNAIGHLTKADFEVALQNIHTNLKSGGLYLFDIFNLEYLQHKDNITKLTIDWQKKSGEVMTREIQYSTISSDGVLASYDIYHEQQGNHAPEIRTAVQTLQVYSAEQLRVLLKRNGFEVVQQTDINGSALKRQESERLLTIARKIVR